MIIPKAYYSHEIPGRMRLRIPSKKLDQEYFSRIEKIMQKLKNVDEVQVQPLTGSVLILHHGKGSELRHTLKDTSKKNHLFRLQSNTVSSRSWADRMFFHLDEWDSQILKATGGVWDLASISAAGMTAMGLFQISQKEFFPPAWALFGNAFEVLATSRRKKGRGRRNNSLGTLLKTGVLRE